MPIAAAGTRPQAPIAPNETAARTAAPRERILRASYELFSQRGIRDVAIDEVIAESGVAKATLYRHFPSKDDLVLAFLERRHQLWSFGVVETGARERSTDPEGRLLAIFDVFHDWFQRDDFEACSFVNVLLEMGVDHPAGRASAEYLARIRSVVEEFAVDAGLRDPREFSMSWHILMTGSIVQAREGDRQAAARGKAMAGALIARHQPVAAN